MSTKEEKAARRAKFEASWVIIRDELVQNLKSEGMPKDALEWYFKNLEYNVPGGKLNRGMSVVDTVEILKGRPLTDDEYHRSAVLGWCVELLQAFFLVADDIMDSSVTRRGQPCWYRQSAVGMVAINDSFLLEAAIYHLLKVYFKKEPYYVDLLELFLETTHKTEMGQLIDLITAPEDVVDLSKFSLDKHHLIVLYKTAFYSFYLPVALALHMCQIPASYTIQVPGSSPNETTTRTVNPYALSLSFLLPLGEYFQIQDDFLDFSAPPEVLGKIGTDILDNKCSWCINTALSLATPEQRKILDENYGRKDAAKEAKVKEVFEAVGLRSVYEKYEDGVYKKLVALIDEIPETGGPGELKREVFRSFLAKIYKRSM